MTHDYDDIINLPHYEPKHHPRMTMWNRAAQFAPFAALTGYDAAIRESGRLTDDWVGLSESGNEEMNRKMELIVSLLPEQPSVTIEYFVQMSIRLAVPIRHVLATSSASMNMKSASSLQMGRKSHLMP